MKRKVYIPLALCAVLIVAGAGYWGYRQDAPQVNVPVAPNTVAVTTCDVQQNVAAPGSLVNLHQVNIEMPANGSLQEILVQPGDLVQQGQVLARLADREQFVSAVTAARLALLQAEHDRDQLIQNAPVEAAQAQQAVAAAQDALDTLQHPTALSIAQAQAAVTDAQTSLDKLLNPDPLAISQAEAAVINDQTAVTDAQAAVDRLKYARGTQSQIDAARAAYVLAQSEVDRLQKAYEGTPGDPNQDPVKAQALSALDAAKNKLSKALANLNWYEATWSEADIQDKTNALAVAQAQLATDQKTLDDLKNPPADQVALAQGVVNDAQKALDRLNHPTDADIALAQAQLAQAQQKWQSLKNGTDQLTQDLAQAKIDDAQATLDKAERDLAAVDIQAPFAGVVLAVNANPGETLSAHSTVLLLNDPQQVEIEASVTEEDFPLLVVGQGAQVYFTAHPDVIVQGNVDRIVPKLVAGSAPTYDIYISLDSPPNGLVEGMTADTEVTIASRPGVLCLPRSIVHASADNKAILQVWNGVAAENREVTTGLRGDSNVEILSGLQTGDQVVVR